MTTTRTFAAALIGLAALAMPAAVSAEGPAVEAIEARIDRLLAAMTLAEKLGQLTVESPNAWEFQARVGRGELGNVINAAVAAETRAIAALAARGRHGIPLLLGVDVLQGYRTQFMVPLGQAASFDADLNRRAAEAIAREASAQGVNWTFAPMVDISRDPRWGRVVEGAGEDPWLGSLLARARVEGYRAGGLVTTAKHFAAYGAPVAGLDYATADLSEASLRDLYLPPFQAAIEAGAATIMPALNALNGVPATVNGFLLDDVLRREWGFRGFVVSDWGAIDQLGNHGVEADRAAMARRAFAAGIDMDMASISYVRGFPGEIAAGRVDMAAVDRAVRRVLRVKLEAGLDTRAIPTPAEAEARMLTPETKALAVEVARRGIVLLKNEPALLPLSGMKRLLLVGGIADSPADHVGPHAARWRPEEVVTIRRAVEARAAKAGVAVDYRMGCDPDCRELPGLSAALEGAREADAIVAVFGEPGEISGEAASRADLGLPDRQQALLDALVAAGKPVVLVLVAGRPLVVPRAVEAIPAVLTTWYPGSVGAIALAEILFGDVSPSGRLPMTWPRHVGQIPIAYNALRSGRPASQEKFTSRYVDVDVRPQFAFGHGLSYTTFRYGEPRLDRASAPVGETVEVSVEVTNAGTRPGREVVQLYVRDLLASRVRPERELKGVAAVDLAPGETRRVTIPLPIRTLGFHREDGAYVVEAGRFRLFVGGSSEATASVDLDVEGPDLVKPVRR